MSLSAIPVSQFGTWQAGYNSAVVHVYKAGTTQHVTLYSDPNLTNVIDNPQILASMLIDGRYYGKFAQPVYTDQAYQWHVSAETSGVFQPSLRDLIGEDASQAVARTRRGAFQRLITDLLDNALYAADFGVIGLAGTTGASPATNTGTIEAAIGAAAAQGGGEVVLPDGTIEITRLSLPANVRLRGQTSGGTILQSAQGEAVITLAGPGSGLVSLTLDGINLIPGSIGVYAVGGEDIVLHDAVVKRFNTGLRFRGLRGASFRDLDVLNCATGFDARGDTDESGSGNGSEFSDNLWAGGSIQQHTTYGMHLQYVDALVRNNRFTGILFAENSGVALQVTGARFHEFESSHFLDNVTHIKFLDGADTSKGDDNKVRGFTFTGGTFDNGEINVDGAAQDITFRRAGIVDVVWRLSLPENPLVLIDCVEGAGVAIVGDGTKLMRWRTADRGEVVGTTSDASPVTAWSHLLAPGEVVVAVATVVANQRNGENYGTFYIAAGARRPGAELDYDAQTGNFAVGNTLVGTVSGARALIVADADAGSTGTLTLRAITGEFLDNEAITDGATGAALANGTLTPQNAVLDASGNDNLRPAATTISTLDYAAEVAAFTVGETLTGGTSGATATIEAVVDNGTDGTLYLSGVSGTFQGNEKITDGAGGEADADGTVTDSGGYDATFTVSGGELHLQVEGLAGHSVEWRVRVDVLRS